MSAVVSGDLKEVSTYLAACTGASFAPTKFLICIAVTHGQSEVLLPLMKAQSNFDHHIVPWGFIAEQELRKLLKLDDDNFKVL